MGYATIRYEQSGNNMLKVLILVLFAAVLISLFSGLAFLFTDSNTNKARRTLYALGVRIMLATALLLTIFYGFYSGQLEFGQNAPWHNRSSSESLD